MSSDPFILPSSSILQVNVDAPRKLNAPFKVEAVVVCDKYHDFLVHTLPQNKFVFDRIVVVTSYEDKETRRVCEVHHVECLLTDRLESRKGVFKKGAGINDGLARLNLDGWAVHMDADILLPPQTRGLLQQANLDPSMVYGIDRFIVKGYAAFDSWRREPVLQHEANSYVHLKAFPIGTRWIQANFGGYVPLGFFQLWHPLTSGVTKYPEGHTDAGREDGLFAMQWPRSHRALIPEIVGYHLESADSEKASNWSGRVTSAFKP
jgi:hypothetical protein